MKPFTKRIVTALICLIISKTSAQTFTWGAGKHWTLGYTDRILGPQGIELGASFPCHLPKSEDVTNVIHRALDLISFDLGPSHVEWVWGPKGPFIVEINPRAGGSGVSRLIELFPATQSQ